MSDTTVTGTAPDGTYRQVDYLDPATLLVDLNVRHDARLDKEFIASVGDLGVLVPVVAVRTADGGVRVRYGHRRVLAAIEAHRPTVPVVIAADEGTDDAAQVERLVGQYAENEHRVGLTSAEQVGVISQLSAFGVSAAQIAKRTKTPRKRVDAALTVAGSTLAQAAVARYDFLDLTQAAAVAEFDADPDAVKALVAAARTGQFDHTAQSLRNERERTRVRDAFAVALREQGVHVVESGPGVNLLRDLTDAEGAVLTPDSHAGCPGHAAYVDRRYGYVDAATGLPPAQPLPAADSGEATGSDPGQEDDEDDEYDDDLTGNDEQGGAGAMWSDFPVAVWVCTDSATHGHRARWDGYRGGGAGKPKLSEMSEEQAEAARAERRDVIVSNKAWTASVTVRREFLRALLARKAPPKGSAALVAAALASDAEVVTRLGGNTLAADLLGCGPCAYGRSPGITALAEQATEARAQVVTLALVLCGYEDDTHTGSWRHVNTGTRRYLTFLEACGYTRSNVERRACGDDPLLDPEQDGAEDNGSN